MIITRIHSSRMRTTRSLPYRVVSMTETPSPQDRDPQTKTPQTETPEQRPAGMETPGTEIPPGQRLRPPCGQTDTG